MLDRRGDPVVISSFQIEPNRRITTEDGDIIDADVTSDRGRVYRDIRFPREAWHSKRNLFRVLGPVDLQWAGTDENIQGVLRLVVSPSALESSSQWSMKTGGMGSMSCTKWVWTGLGAELSVHARLRLAERERRAGERR